MQIRRLKKFARRKRTKKTSAFKPPELNGNQVAADTRLVVIANAAATALPVT
jgi:hypothetical protein